MNTSAAALTFYTHPMSRGRMVRWMLEECRASYDTVVLDYQGGMYLEGEVTHAPYFTMTTVRRPAAAAKDDAKAESAKGDQA